MRNFGLFFEIGIFMHFFLLQSLAMTLFALLHLHLLFSRPEFILFFVRPAVMTFYPISTIETLSHVNAFYINRMRPFLFTLSSTCIPAFIYIFPDLSSANWITTARLFSTTRPL